MFTTDTNCAGGTCDFQSALDFAAGSPGLDTLTLPSTDVLLGSVLVTSAPFEYARDEDEDAARDDDCDITITGAGSGLTMLSGGGTSPVLRIGALGGSRAEPTC